MPSRLWPAIAAVAGCSQEPAPFVDLHGPPRWYRADVAHVVATGDALSGANLDGLLTYSGSPTCRQDPRATSKSLVFDGPNGVDNNFARVLVPRAMALCRDAAAIGHQKLERRTFFVRLDDLGGENDSSVDAEVFPAQWTGARWVLDKSFVADGHSLIRLKGQSIDGVWSGRTDSTATLAIPLELCGVRPRIAVRLKFASVVTTDGRGMLAGLLDLDSTSRLLSDLRASPGFIGSGICPGTAAYDLSEISLKVDPLDLVSSSPTLNGTEAACNAVSFGVALDWVEVAAPEDGVVTEEPPVTGACP